MLIYYFLQQKKLSNRRQHRPRDYNVHDYTLNKTVKFRQKYLNANNGEPAVLVHHGIVCRWRCGSLVT